LKRQDAASTSRSVNGYHFLTAKTRNIENTIII
jgi:hypothetical protein